MNFGLSAEMNRVLNLMDNFVLSNRLGKKLESKLGLNLTYHFQICL